MHDDDEQKPFIIVKRVKKIKKGGHHGGSWKIAYADFVTAMMAFFLLMWLLSLLNKYQLQGIAEYFNKPLKDVIKSKPKQEEAPEPPSHVKKPPTKAKEKPQPGMGDKQAQLEAIKKDLETKLQTQPELKQFKNQLNFTVTADGLKIELRDLENKPMFTTGKADFDNYAKPLLTWLGKELNQYPNQVMIVGHTDAAPYRSPDYTNWELSVDRANATRRSLVKNGMEPAKILRVVGVGDTKPLDAEHILNPSNRRIEIIVLTDEAVKKVDSQ